MLGPGSISGEPGLGGVTIYIDLNNNGDLDENEPSAVSSRDENSLGSYEIAGLIPFSGHTITHFTVRKERGIDGKQPILDEMAPLYHVRKDAPPLLLITGDRELEMLGRYEENAYLWRMMQVVEHPDTDLMELDGYNHGQMAEPAFPLLLRFIKRIEK